MKDFVSNLNKDLINHLLMIDLEESSTVCKAQKSIICLKAALQNLKVFALNYNFSSKEEEIWFFKEIKPDIFSRLIYFVNVFNIESRRPMGSYEIQKNYLSHELKKLTFFFNNHLEFYQYYRMNSTYLDDKYFVRGKDDIHLYQDGFMFYVDSDFSTSHDYMVATILAHDRLEVYLKKELETLSIKLSNPNREQTFFANNLSIQWTDSKTALVELIYALYACGSINHGNCDIRELTGFFEQIFNIRLPDIYRTYLEIKIRSTPTKYIDNLKTALLRKMEEDL